MADVLQKRLSCFVKWIAPEPEKKKETAAHADDVLDRLKSKAIEHGIDVKDVFISGSFKKETGLRRHMRGHSEVEGQDVDLMFVVEEPDSDSGFAELITKFGKVAKASYPNTPQEPTKCSVKLAFSNPQIAYDLVPVYQTSDRDYQLLVRKDLKRRMTSAKNHISFVTTRTSKTNNVRSSVQFNECIRLMKWWRENLQQNLVYTDEIPSMAIELLFAKAFDSRGVKTEYIDTLIDWFWEVHSILKAREPVFFRDFARGVPSKTPSSGIPMALLDPVNWENNVFATWTATQIDELVKGVNAAVTNLQRAKADNDFGNDSASLSSLAAVFGTSFEHHCGDER